MNAWSALEVHLRFKYFIALHLNSPALGYTIGPKYACFHLVEPLTDSIHCGKVCTITKEKVVKTTPVTRCFKVREAAKK